MAATAEGASLAFWAMGNNERSETDIKQAFNDDRMVPFRANDRFRSTAAHGLELTEQKRNVVGGVLDIEQQPIEADRIQDLGDEIVGQGSPQADLTFVLPKAVLENVGTLVFCRIAHAISPCFRPLRCAFVQKCQRYSNNGIDNERACLVKLSYQNMPEA